MSLIYLKEPNYDTGPESPIACQYEQLCAGLKAGIDGAFRGVLSIWDTELTTEDWGFLLLDTKKALNEINGIGMLWTVRHLWPSGARFIIKCYCHWSLLVLRVKNETATFLHCREGVTQGEPLYMIAYGIGTLPLIKNPKAEFPDVTKPWYDGNAGELGTFVTGYRVVYRTRVLYD